MNFSIIKTCYEYQNHLYHIQDAKRQVSEYLDNNSKLQLTEELTETDYDILATLFEENHDCNVADNIQWYNLVETYIKQLPSMNQFVKETLESNKDQTK